MPYRGSESMVHSLAQDRLIGKALIAVFLFLGNGDTSYADAIVNYERGRVISVEPITKKSYRWVPRLTCEEGVTVFYSASNMQSNHYPSGPMSKHSVPPSPNSGANDQSCRSYRDKEYYEKEVGYNVTFEYLGTVRTVRFERPPRLGYVLLKTEKKVYAIE
jgi:uncharacterized protein YcfJ